MPSLEKLPCNSDCTEKKCNCETFQGNVSKVIELSKDSCSCEVKADMVIDKKRSIRIWGQITDCEGNPVPCALTKLIREVINCGKITYVGVAHSVTDCLGFYQFDVCAPCKNEVKKYRVLVGKQSIGDEFVLEKSECDPCESDCPCVK